MKSYDWIIVGGGIAGISVAEIISREGHSVALIEKNKKLASVATKEFHEWVHELVKIYATLFLKV